MNENIIEFEKSAGIDVLKFFDKTIDEEGYIVEKSKPTQRVLDMNGEEIKTDEFAGITPGSEIFVKSDLISLIHLADRLWAE